PAQAGIHAGIYGNERLMFGEGRACRASRRIPPSRPDTACPTPFVRRRTWIPAFAGMTVSVSYRSRSGQNRTCAAQNGPALAAVRPHHPVRLGVRHPLYNLSTVIPAKVGQQGEQSLASTESKTRTR